MSESTSAAVRDVFNHLTVIAAVRWAERILTYDGLFLDTSTKRTNYFLIPVKTSIIIVADVKYARVSMSIPTVNI